MKTHKKISDYVKAWRKASREEEIRLYGHPLPRRKVHKSKRTYNRKKIKAGDKNLPFPFLIVN